MEAIQGVSILIIFGVFLFLIMFTYYVPIGLFITAYFSGVQVKIFKDLVGMRLRKVPPTVIIRSQITATKAGIALDLGKLEAHYLAGGNVNNVINALISANKANLDLSFERAAAIDLAGRDVLDAVKMSVIPKVIETPLVSGVAKDGIQLRAVARITVRANLERLVGGAGEATILARVGEGIVSTIGTSASHKEVLENPDNISKSVLAKGLDAGTAFEILSIDIADVDVGSNIGAILQADQAEADLKVARAKAEERRAAAVALEQEMIAEVARMRAKVVEAESDKLMKMEEFLSSRIIGQEEAVKKLTKAIRRARAGLKNRNRPIGSFIFLGPTGVGKTELGKVLSRYLFDSDESLVRIDMSEYMEKYSVSRLVGAPPGYVGYEEGGQLTEKVRRKPYSVVLLDEIEKAHPDVFNILLQVLDDGLLTDSLGRKVDFKNTIIIMTSNVGTREIKSTGAFGFGSDNEHDKYESLKNTVQDAMKRLFNPEFLNRVDDTIVFRNLEKADIKKIIKIELNELIKNIRENNMELHLDESAEEFLAEKGFDPKFGARPLKRAIQKYLEDPLAEEIILGTFKEGAKILIKHKADTEEIYFVEYPEQNLLDATIKENPLKLTTGIDDEIITSDSN